MKSSTSVVPSVPLVSGSLALNVKLVVLTTASASRYFVDCVGVYGVPPGLLSIVLVKSVMSL